MTKQHKPRGGAHNVKPAHLRRVSLYAMVSPETKRLLRPYADRTNDTGESVGQIIDAAVKMFFTMKDYSHPTEIDKAMMKMQQGEWTPKKK